MGATSFERRGFGKTIKEAFVMAKEEATDELGHQDGYSGDLNSKHTWEQVLVPKGVNPLKYLRWIEIAADSLYEEEEKAKKRILRKVPAHHQPMVLRYAKTYRDKYGKALGVKIKGKEAAEYRAQNRLKGKKGDVFVFFGTAPC